MMDLTPKYVAVMTRHRPKQVWLISADGMLNLNFQKGGPGRRGFATSAAAWAYARKASEAYGVPILSCDEHRARERLKFAQRAAAQTLAAVTPRTLQ
jgi:hypothetical protein